MSQAKIAALAACHIDLGMGSSSTTGTGSSASQRDIMYGWMQNPAYANALWGEAFGYGSGAGGQGPFQGTGGGGWGPGWNANPFEVTYGEPSVSGTGGGAGPWNPRDVGNPGNPFFGDVPIGTQIPGIGGVGGGLGNPQVKSETPTQGGGSDPRDRSVLAQYGINPDTRIQPGQTAQVGNLHLMVMGDANGYPLILQNPGQMSNGATLPDPPAWLAAPSYTAFGSDTPLYPQGQTGTEMLTGGAAGGGPAVSTQFTPATSGGDNGAFGLANYQSPLEGGAYGVGGGGGFNSYAGPQASPQSGLSTMDDRVPRLIGNEDGTGRGDPTAPSPPGSGGPVGGGGGSAAPPPQVGNGRMPIVPVARPRPTPTVVPPRKGGGPYVPNPANPGTGGTTMIDPHTTGYQWGSGGAASNRLAAGNQLWTQFNQLADPNANLDPKFVAALTQEGMNATRSGYADARAQLNRQVANTGNSAGYGAAMANMGSRESGAYGQQARQNVLSLEAERQRRRELGLQGISGLYGGEGQYNLGILGALGNMMNSPVSTRNQQRSLEGSNTGSFNLGVNL